MAQKGVPFPHSFFSFTRVFSRVTQNSSSSFTFVSNCNQNCVFSRPFSSFSSTLLSSMPFPFHLYHSTTFFSLRLFFSSSVRIFIFVHVHFSLQSRKNANSLIFWIFIFYIPPKGKFLFEKKTKWTCHKRSRKIIMILTA